MRINRMHLNKKNHKYNISDCKFVSDDEDLISKQ